jgi:type IV pilus assembly protein PilY1
LFAVNPKTGAVKTGYPLSTGSGGAGTPSNLGKLSVWSTNPTVNNSVELVYAGDLNGDLWRFDISGETGTAGDVFKLAHLASSGGVAQPITTKPELTELSDGTRVVYVGTGQYLEIADMTSTTAQSFYAIKDTLGADNGLGSPNQVTWNPQTDLVDDGGTDVAAFLERKLIGTKSDGSAITQTVSGATRNYRMVCAGDSSTVDATSGQCTGEDPTEIDWGLNGGWFVDLPDSGERMNVDMKLVQGTLVFATNVPAADSCTVGGTAWFNQLDFQTGLSVGNTMASAQIADSLVVGVTAIRIGDTFKAIVTKSNYQQETLTVDTSGGPGGFLGKRGLWREFEAY